MKISVAIDKRSDRFELYRRFKPDLVVFGELEIAQAYDSKTTLLSSQDKTKRWLKVLDGSGQAIAGTRSSLFLPFKHLNTIIIDDPRHPGHREEQTPKYWSYKVALELAKLHNSHLIIGMPALTVNDYYYIKTKQYKILRLPTWKLPDIVIKNPSGTQQFAGKTLYFLPRKGDYSGTICKTCQSLQPFPAPNLCQTCQSTEFRPYGIGTQELARELSAQAIDTDHPLRNENWQLKTVVATHKIFDYDIQFDTTVVSHIDHLLQLPDPFINEYLFEILVKLAQITTKTLIIETKLPDSEVFGGINNWKKFLENELEKRKIQNLPPFSRLVKLTSLKQMPVPQISKAIKVSPIHTNLQGQFQAIAFLPINASLKDFAVLSDWKVEPDPISLL